MQKYKNITFNYDSTALMSSLITDNYQTLLVLSRFGISLGFGDKTIGEVCAEYDVDTDTFLIINNIKATENNFDFNYHNISLLTLIKYLQNSHDYFLNFRIPDIRKKLVAALNNDVVELNKAVVTYFDNFAEAVHKHMKNEEKKIFPYVVGLLENKGVTKIPINLSKQHNQIETGFSEFKNLMIKYYPAEKRNEMNQVIVDIFICEKDLESHNTIEEKLFLPAIIELEKQLSAQL